MFSCLIPAYNENNAVIEAICYKLLKYDIKEIIIIDDGSVNPVELTINSNLIKIIRKEKIVGKVMLLQQI